MSERRAELLIVAGGSELAALAVVDAARRARIPYAVITLTPRSILRGDPDCVAFQDLSSEVGAWTRLRDAFLAECSRVAATATKPLAILPSDDGSLRLLNECRDEVLGVGEYPRARALRMGGVDKAEVIELAQRQGVQGVLAPSRVLHAPDEAAAALAALGPDAVFKPALKPIDMDLTGIGGHGLKVVTRCDAREPESAVLARLSRAWPLSTRWIAQPRLIVGAGRERSVCAVRGQTVCARQVVEQAKYPRMGGTAYWVSVDHRTDLIEPATRLLAALDVVGMCELSFLPDSGGMDHLIELNPRPWLQVGLMERSGFNIVSQTVAAMRGGAVASQPCGGPARDWLQPERMLLALLARECGLREFGRMARLAMRASTVIGGYDGSVPHSRTRMLLRSLRKLVKQ